MGAYSLEDLLTYHEVDMFLKKEAEILDSGDFESWLALLEDEVRIQVPVRLTREKGALSDTSGSMEYMLEDKETLRLRIERLKSEYAWAEDPPSRIKHVIVNLMVDANDGERIHARYVIIILRSRGESTETDLLFGRRSDILKKTPNGLKLVNRVTVLDHSVLGTKNLSFFI
jgi:3-phenylpropionate/cinnamic acid dioxygenase small subunit